MGGAAAVVDPKLRQEESHIGRSISSCLKFLEHCFRWLQPGGVLVMVIPAQRVATCGQVLAAHFREISIYRLTEPDSERYQQVVMFAIRSTRQGPDHLKDIEVSQGKGPALATSQQAPGSAAAQ